jgi:hypothetical protein
MSDEGDPKHEPAAPETAQSVSAPSLGPRTALRAILDERRRRVALALLHLRYVCGYLAAGFLVSVPIALGSKVGNGLSLVLALRQTGLSLLYGLVLIVPFLALWPFTRIDWKAMNVPEFQLFELAVTRSAALASILLFVLSVQLRVFSMLAEPRLVWTVFTLMVFAWGRIKVQTRLFPEFYASGKP